MEEKEPTTDVLQEKIKLLEAELESEKKKAISYRDAYYKEIGRVSNLKDALESMFNLLKTYTI